MDVCCEGGLTRCPRPNQFARFSIRPEVAKLIGRIAALQNSAGQAAYVAALKVRYGQKRNFMKLVD